MVKVSAAAGRPIDIPTAKKWIDKAKVFNEQKHMSFEIFIRLMVQVYCIVVLIC